MTLIPTDPVLDYFQRLHQLVLAQADEIQPAMARIMERSPIGSPTDEDTKKVLHSTRTSDRQVLWQRVQLNCVHTAVNVGDHVRALALLLSQPSVGVPIYAHSTVARVAVESAAMTAYLLDCDASFDVRFARGIAFLIDDSVAASRAAKRVPGNPHMAAPGTEVDRRHSELLALIKRARIEITAGKKDTLKGIRVAPDAPEVPVDIKATELIVERFSDMPAVYNLLSGVVHGRPHMLAMNSRIATGHGVWDTNPLDVGGSVLAAMRAAHITLAAHARHRGRDDDPALATTRANVTAVDEIMQQFGRLHMPLPQPQLRLRF